MENMNKAEYSTRVVNKITYKMDDITDCFSTVNVAKKLRREVCTDVVIVEQPLQITLSWLENSLVKSKVFSITMRTPGHDKLLIIGLLHSEGVIKQLTDIDSINVESNDASGEEGKNEWMIQFSEGFIPNLASLERYQLTYSSCGLCGSTSLKALQLKTDINLSIAEHNNVVSVKSLLLLSSKMRSEQGLFDDTGGVHGAALFDQCINMQHLYEDIGRHNAVDKVIGALLTNKELTNKELSITNKQVTQQHPLWLLLVSGRISFEIVQKTIMAGISILVGVGAPSDLAIQAAKQFDITLIGFVSDKGFNVYHGDWRLNNDET